MSNEIADALRRFADQIDSGQVGQVHNPVEACIVLSNADGVCGATYIGRKAPARDAGTFLLANGIQRFVVGSPSETAATTFGATRGSTH